MSLSSLDLGTMLINAKEAFVGLKAFIAGPTGGVGLAGLVGMFYVAQSLFKMWKKSEDNGVNIKAGEILSPLLIGGLLLQWTFTSDMASETLGLSGGALGYKAKAGGTQYSQDVVDAVLVGVSALGAISIFRGLLKWKAAGEGLQNNSGSDPVWGGLWHILGGAIGLNISDFLNALGL